MESLKGKIEISREYEGDIILIQDGKEGTISLTDWIIEVLGIDEEDYNSMNNKKIEITIKGH